jgi:hypothetical protein
MLGSTSGRPGWAGPLRGALELHSLRPDIGERLCIHSILHFHLDQRERTKHIDIRGKQF